MRSLILSASSRDRFPFLLASMIAAAMCIPHPDAQAAESGIVLKPGAVWWERDEAPPSPLRYDSVYLVRRSNPAGVLLHLPRGVGWRVALSPDGALVAYDVNHTGDPGNRPDLASTYAVAVSDTSGRDVASFAGGVRLAWSPDGKALAVAIACPPGPIPAFDSILVWEPDKGIVMARKIPQSRGKISWAGADTVLIGPSMIGYSSALSYRTGIVGPNLHSGSDVSFADSIGNPLGMPLAGAGPSCWVRYKGEGALVVSYCNPWVGVPGARRRECRVGLIDAGTRRLIGWTDGRLVGPTADSREAVVVRGGGIAFIGDADWNLGPVPVDRTQSVSRAPRSPLPKKRRPSRGIQFAFTMQQIWSGDNGRRATALGYVSGPVYVLRAGERPRELLSRPFGFWPLGAVLNRSGDLVAISAIPQDDSGDSASVFVADTSGSIVARFEGRARFRWSPDGNHLATVGTKDLLVWSRHKGVVGTLAMRPEDYEWTTSGALMLRNQGRVVRLDWRSGDTTGTSHQAVDVSPDGGYSIDAVEGARVFDDRSRTEITGCSWGAVRGLGRDLCAKPFWIRERGVPHRLCVSPCDMRLPGLEGQKVWGCGVAVIDVGTMEMGQVIPGKLIGRTADNRSVVVLRGDSLDIVPLERTAADRGSHVKRMGTHKARLRVVVEQWGKHYFSGKAPTDTIGVYTIEVREGDWLPEWSENVHRCEREFRVRRVIGSSRVEIEYNSAFLWIQPASSAPQHEGLALVTSEATTTLGTRSSDGGRYVRLRIDR